MAEPNSVRNYRTDVDRHIVPVIGGLRMSAVRVEDVERVFTAVT